MNTIEIIFLVILLILLAIIIFLVFKLKKPITDLNLDNLKDSLDRIEADFKNNFGTWTDDQKKSIEKWTETLKQIGTNDKSINNLKTEMEKLVKEWTDGQVENAKNITSTFKALEANLKNIDTLKTDVKDLNNIFFSTTKRGALGEFTLRSILINILGENSKIWKEQVQLTVETNTSGKGNVDVVLYTGEGSENVIIDAKFPLEKYRIMEKIVAIKKTNLH